jgi:phosphatidylserine/phosphatidylglycerophosphate/cardiolipin synthase-like enzyme
MTVSDKVYSLTHSQKTLTAAFAASPASSPGHLAKTLYAEHHKKPISSGGYLETFMGALQLGNANETRRIPPSEPTQADLDRAAECGNFGSRPSDIFLKIYCDVLATLDTNPWAGVVSPPLLGSRGVVNLSIISVIPDIIQHHYDCIVRAESEVFLATNFWQASKSASKICEALLELSRRAMKRGKKVVVKMMYDRANLKMLTESHVIVDDAEMVSDEVKLPKRSDMPGIDFELVNFHQPVFGTFHCKFMIVDRKIALLNSNNIQDRPNMEMMIHLEGPIVDSLYDTALISWFRPMHPPLPLLDTRYRPPEEGYKFGMENEYATTWILDGSKGAELFQTLQQGAGGRHDGDVDKRGKEDPTSSESLGTGVPFISGTYQTITEHLNAGDQPDTHASIPYEPPASSRDEYTPHILHTRHGECPMVLVNRAPNGSPGNPASGLHNTQDAAWLAGLKYAQRKVFIQSPTLNAVPVVEGILNAVRRGIECTLYLDVGFNDGGEALPGQGGTNEEVSKAMFAQLTDEEKEKLQLYWYTGKDQIKPINASAQKRNCHVKLMIIDDSVGIVGNGNQDTQSWYHSQEVNVMVDNPTVCQEWFDGIRRNQNTHLHKLEKDGIYRDTDGNPLTDSTGVGSGFRGVVKGIQGSIARVRGKGGF